MTLCRVFMNRQIEKIYQILFERIFFLIYELIDRIDQWQHIHDENLYDIVMNMNLNQINNIILQFIKNCFLMYYKEFVRYFRNINSQVRDVVFHAKSTIIFCQIHFKRNVIRTLSFFIAREEYESFWQLFQITILIDYFRLIELIKNK